jgi:hypothetical protein
MAPGTFDYYFSGYNGRRTKQMSRFYDDDNTVTTYPIITYRFRRKNGLPAFGKNRNWSKKKIFYQHRVGEQNETRFRKTLKVKELKVTCNSLSYLVKLSFRWTSKVLFENPESIGIEEKKQKTA